jgi:hypothetical protein
MSNRLYVFATHEDQRRLPRTPARASCFPSFQTSDFPRFYTPSNHRCWSLDSDLCSSTTLGLFGGRSMSSLRIVSTRVQKQCKLYRGAGMISFHPDRTACIECLVVCAHMFFFLCATHNSSYHVHRAAPRAVIIQTSCVQYNIL